MIAIFTVLMFTQDPSSTAVAVVDSPNPAAMEVVLEHRVFPSGVSTEDQYAAWLTTQQKAFGPPSSPEEASKQANWILAFACEPAITRVLLDRHSPTDLDLILKRVDAALSLLPETPEHEDVEMLRDFGVAVKQFALSRAGRADKAALAQSASNLAIWLDDDRHDIPPSAILWQCLLYQEAGRQDRALETIPAVHTPVEGNPAAFYSRILRCQIHAQGGRHSLALALILRMEEHCGGWFAERATAAENVLLVQRHKLVENYNPEIGELASKAVSQWPLRAQQALLEASEPRELLRLHPAIPVLFSNSETRRPKSPEEAPAEPE